MQHSAVSPAHLIDAIATAIRRNLPTRVSPEYFEAFMARNRPRLIEVVARLVPSASESWSSDLPPDLWSPAQRTEANIKAMQVLASTPLESITDEDRRMLAMYSGWGGLSIDRVRSRFPAQLPAPEQVGLIHEYYIFGRFRTRPHNISYLHRNLSTTDRLRAGPAR